MNGKLTKSGGREYAGTEGAQSRAPNSYEHICDPDSEGYYRGTGMEPVPANSEFPAQAPESPCWADYNGNTHLGNHPKPTEPGDARFPNPYVGKKI